MEARASCRHDFARSDFARQDFARQDFAHDFEPQRRYDNTRFSALSTQRDPLDSEAQLRLSKELWDRRWSRWWGYNWRRKRDLALRNQRYLDNRERFLRRLDSESDSERGQCRHVTFNGNDRFPPPPTFRRKLGSFLSASRARIGRAGQCIARRFKRSPPRAAQQPPCLRMEPPPADWTWRRPPAPPLAEEACLRPWHRPHVLPPTDASISSLEQLSRRLERLRTGDRAGQQRTGHSQRGCGAEYTLGVGVETVPSPSSLSRSHARSVTGDSRPTFSDRQQTASPVVANMQRNDPPENLHGDTKYDQTKLGMNQGLPFMYPNYPNVYTNPGGRETRLFSSVATQTDRPKKTEESRLPETIVAHGTYSRTRNSETQTPVVSRRDKETQWVNSSEAPRTFSTQTEIISKNMSQQMPSASDTNLVETRKADEEQVENLCDSFLRADSIRSVFGRNKTHVVIYRPELVGEEDNKTVKLTAMDVFLPGAVSYDRYYAELTSDGTASPNNGSGTQRENAQLTETITPLIEVISIEEQGADGDGKKKKNKKWFCNKR